MAAIVDPCPPSFLDNMARLQEILAGLVAGHPGEAVLRLRSSPTLITPLTARPR
jgi:hypothetical protein